MKYLQSFKYSQVMAPATAATAVRSASFDVRGADYASLLITLGPQLNTNATAVTLQLAEADAATGPYVTFNSSFNRTVLNSGANGAVVAYHVDLKARRAFLRIQTTPDTTTNGPVIVSAVGALDLEINPVANSSYADVVVIG